MTGWGKALVCCVGENTLLAHTRKPKDLEVEEQKTFLEQRLEVAADQISKFAKLAAALVVVTRLLFLVVRRLAGGEDDPALFSQASLAAVGEIFIVAVVLLMVAVPEGLPLAVSIAMALSITSLKDDEILIKNIDAVQSCAMFNDLCVGKTGTLTSGKLAVKKF
jgi:P-type E1-E2 ATPase